MKNIGNNIDVVQSIVCHVERSEPLGRRPVGERQTSRKCLLEKLLGGDKPNGAKARSSEELKFLSSQATLSYRAAVATDAKPRAEISLLNLCRGAKEGNCKLTDAFIPRRPNARSFRRYALSG